MLPSGATDPCLSRPCLGGGTCEAHDGTFTCFCTTDRTGERCERALSLSRGDVKVAGFDGASFVELRAVESAEHKFSLEMEFR